MQFSIIVAVDEKMGIGIKNQLPWHLSADLKHFASVTQDAPVGKQNAVIMGRRTWESLPEKYRPLPGRVNVVLSREFVFTERKPGDGVYVWADFNVALNFVYSFVNKVFVIGGATIFSRVIDSPYLSAIYITRVQGDFKCDVFFPAIPKGFKKVEESALHEEKGTKFRFERWERV